MERRERGGGEIVGLSQAAAAAQSWIVELAGDGEKERGGYRASKQAGAIERGRGASVDDAGAMGDLKWKGGVGMEKWNGRGGGKAGGLTKRNDKIKTRPSCIIQMMMGKKRGGFWVSDTEYQLGEELGRGGFGGNLVY